MKDLYHLNPKAYQEGFEVLQALPEASKQKIPEEIWQFVKENRDIDYEITFETLQEKDLLEETSLFLAIIYKAYLATDEEKKIIQVKENAVQRKKEAESYQKYNPNDIFKKKL